MTSIMSAGAGTLLSLSSPNFFVVHSPLPFVAFLDLLPVYDTLLTVPHDHQVHGVTRVTIIVLFFNEEEKREQK